MHVDEILDEAMWLGAIRERAGANMVVQATLEALAQLLTADEAARVSEELPPPLAAQLAPREGANPTDPQTLYRRVASLEGISLGLAVEHVRAACQAVAGALGPEPRLVLERRLDAEWAVLFARPERAPALDWPAPASAAHEHTLAGGRPGSTHPLSEAHPGSERPLSEARPGSEHPLSEARDDRFRR